METDRKPAPAPVLPHWPRKSNSLFHTTLPLFMPAPLETAPVLVPLRWPRKSSSLLQSTLPLSIPARSETNGNRSKTGACAVSSTRATQSQLAAPKHASSFSSAVRNNWKLLGNGCANAHQQDLKKEEACYLDHCDSGRGNHASSRFTFFADAVVS